MQLPSKEKTSLQVNTNSIEVTGSPRFSARGTVQTVVNINRMKKKKTQKRPKSPEFIVLNTSPKKTDVQRREIEAAHERVFGKDKKVKFHDLKYDLDDLFENKEARAVEFEEPLIEYKNLDGFIPAKLTYPNLKNKDGSVPPPPKLSKMDEARLNNYAIINLENPPPKKISPVKVEQPESPMKKFDILKQPNLLFYCVQKDQIENLKSLTEEYKQIQSPSKIKKEALSRKHL